MPKPPLPDDRELDQALAQGRDTLGDAPPDFQAALRNALNLLKK